MKLYEYLDKHYSKEEQKKLKVLDCSDSDITSLEGIENLTILKDLYCHSNQLTTLIGIENLTFLEYLSCFNNPLPYKSNILESILKEIKIEKRKTLIKSILI